MDFIKIRPNSQKNRKRKQQWPSFIRWTFGLVPRMKQTVESNAKVDISRNEN